ncbi:hypothetical protein C8R46DRAFT_1325924 [Mycena filopes]|nr:hypothetical protein C8R46DRAFT_1325924 [Mycena filopes]
MAQSTYPPGTPAPEFPLPPSQWGHPSSSPLPDDRRLPPLPTDSVGWGSSPAIQNSSAAFQHHTPATQDLDLRSFSFNPPPIIKPLFIDTLARDMRLEEGQKQSLHDFVQLGSTGTGLSQADLATRLYSLAVQFADIAERHRKENAETPEDWKALWRDLKIRLDGNFSFTKDQEKNIRGIVRDVIIESSRTVYSTMHIDVLAVIRRRAESLGLDNVSGVPAREQALASQVRSAGSSVRNALRKEIISSIQSESWLSLAQFTYDSLSKYKLGGVGVDVPPATTAHVAILRRFAFDHPDLKAESPTTPEGDENDAPPPTKKARKTKGQSGGRIPAGEDFWGQVDVYFRKELEHRGKTLTGPKWKPYIDQLIVDDNSKFRGKTPGEPVETGVQGEEGIDGIGAGAGLSSSSASTSRSALVTLL